MLDFNAVPPVAHAPSGAHNGSRDAALEGRLHRKRQHLVPNCQRILKALAKTGEVALIDEATG